MQASLFGPMAYLLFFDIEERLQNDVALGSRDYGAKQAGAAHNKREVVPL